MQEAEMRGVDVALEPLQPVAGALGQHRLQFAFIQQGGFDHRHWRRFGAGAHVDPDQAGAFGDAVGLGFYLLPEVLVGRQVGHVDAVAIGVELPAVVDAADAAVLIPAIEQGGTAVWVAAVHDPRDGRPGHGRR